MALMNTHSDWMSLCLRSPGGSHCLVWGILFVKSYMTEDPLRRSLLNSNSPLLLCSGLPTKPLLGGGVKIKVEVKPLIKILDITHLQVQPTDVFCHVLMPQDLGSTHPSKMTNNNPSLYMCLWSTAMEAIIL